MAQSVWKQYRSVQVDGTDLSEFDTEVLVGNPKEDPMTFEVDVYNIPESVFEGITSGESAVSIELGWENGPQETVIVGPVENTNREYDGRDIRYRLEGSDGSSAALNSNVRGSFKEQTPAAIAEELAGMVGLGAETDSISSTIDPWYSVGSYQTVAQWLDELVDYAGQFTGETWTYWAEAGTLYFVVDDGIDDEIPMLSYDGLLVSLNPKADGETREQTLEFEAMLDPRIKRGQQVRIETDAHTGNYEVRSYEMESSRVTGDHIVRGTVEQVTPAESYSDTVVQYGGGAGPPGEREVGITE